jgi:hypothetical protein
MNLTKHNIDVQDKQMSVCSCVDRSNKDKHRTLRNFFKLIKMYCWN